MHYKTHMLKVKLDTSHFQRLEIPTFIWLHIKAIATREKCCTYWEKICEPPISKFAYIINYPQNTDNIDDAPHYATDYELEIKSPHPRKTCNDKIWLCGRGEVIVKYQTLENERLSDYNL